MCLASWNLHLWSSLLSITLFNIKWHFSGMSKDCFMRWILAGPTFVSYGFNLEEGRSVSWSKNTRRSPFRHIWWLGLPRWVIPVSLSKFSASIRFCCMLTDISPSTSTGAVWFHCCWVGKNCADWRRGFPLTRRQKERTGFHLFVPSAPNINIIWHSDKVDQGLFHQWHGKNNTTFVHT